MVVFGNEKFVVTPWKVEGEIDYEKLLEKFGAQKITEEIREKIKEIAGEVHPLIRRGFYYAHRDLDLALKDYEEGKGFFLYTGIAPSKSQMHIGHLVPFILTKWFQEKFDVNVYIMIPDDEKFWAKKADDPEKTKKLAYENIKNIAALGFDPDKTFVFIDTEYIKHLYSGALYVARLINYSLAKAVFGFTGETSIGLIFYPALQITPTLFEEKRPLIPCGIDQDPYFRIQRDIAPKLGYYKTSEILSKFVWGLKGPNTKMSASDPTSAIFLADDCETVKRKIMKYAFSGGKPTIEEHRKYGGNPDIDVSFFWLKILFEPDDKKLKEIEEKYKSGELLTGELKQYTIKKICEFLEEFRKRRKQNEKLIDKYMYDGKLAQEMWNWKFQPKRKLF